ncbi:MAG TPA: hypothetical protein VLA58_01095 [Chitinophagaceae bacterium]|nr:hypothetical protein [Chitinophagaceae bacterium]
MRTRTGKLMIIGALALALAGFYGMKAKTPCETGDVCKERVPNRSEKMIKTGLPILEALTRHLIRM